ncbi:Uncharacterized protein HZ326_29220 [Fusarium oxysporum f. sp. albedinis]|nr:Uncharacterized protein HZ326_29220 [Fusarium oxysporum f. sp. albedinis]
MPRSVSSTSRSCYSMYMSSRPEQRPEGEAGSGPGIQNKLLQMLRMQTRHTELTRYGIKHEWWSQQPRKPWSHKATLALITASLPLTANPGPSPLDCHHAIPDLGSFPPLPALTRIPESRACEV